ncbi:4Fe-4S dicluster domain-containing protein [Fibrobacterota bacterium]
MITNKTIRGIFARDVEKVSRQKFADCYQCGTCAAGCPVVGYMDLLPSQVMRAVQLGQIDKVLSCKTIWLCASCETCTTRCPKELDVARIMDRLREMSLKQGKVHADMKDIATFHKVFLQTIKHGGKLFEAGMIGAYKMLRPRHLFEDLVSGLKMGLNGKVKPFPHMVKDRAAIKKIFKRSKKAEL